MVQIKIKNTRLYKLPIVNKEVYVCFRKKIDEESIAEIISNHKEKEIIFLE